MSFSHFLSKSGNAFLALKNSGPKKTFHMFARKNSYGSLRTLSLTQAKPYVYQIDLNRPDNYNAINNQMWTEIHECFRACSTDPDCRVVVLSGAGKHFTAGIDLSDMMSLGQQMGQTSDVARKGMILQRIIKQYQDSITSLELCSKPVITAIHSACIGAGVDLITASDIRYCTSDAFFQIKEVEIGMAADVGTLQRLPKIIGCQSLVRELCFTGRKFGSAEALTYGLVSKVFADKKSMIESVLAIAETIAEKSPIAIQATKSNLVFSQNRTNQEGLDHIREINKLCLQSDDFVNAVSAQVTKGEKPIFSKL